MLVYHRKLDVSLSARLRYAYLHGTGAGDDCADDIGRDTANAPACRACVIDSGVGAVAGGLKGGLA